MLHCCTNFDALIALRTIIAAPYGLNRLLIRPSTPIPFLQLAVWIPTFEASSVSTMTRHSSTLHVLLSIAVFLIVSTVPLRSAFPPRLIVNPAVDTHAGICTDTRILRETSAFDEPGNKITVASVLFGSPQKILIEDMLAVDKNLIIDRNGSTLIVAGRNAVCPFDIVANITLYNSTLLITHFRIKGSQ